MRGRRRAYALILLGVASCLVVSGIAGGISAQPVVVLQADQDAPIISMKVVPGQRICALTGPRHELWIFGWDGSRLATVDLSSVAPDPAPVYFLDLDVGPAGSLYLLGIWRPAGGEMTAGVLRVTAAGEIDRWITLDKSVEARRLLVSNDDDFIVVKLDPDWYHGRTAKAGVVHRFDANGHYLRTLLEVDGKQYAPQGTRDLQGAYSVLMSWLAHLPLAWDEQGRLVTLAPGTSRLLTIDPTAGETAEAVDLDLAPVRVPDFSVPAPTASERREVTRLQVRGDLVIAEVRALRRHPENPELAAGVRFKRSIERPAVGWPPSNSHRS